MVIAGIVAAPLAMPILPVAAAVKYCAFFGVQEVKVETVPLNSLPQLFGDMLAGSSRCKPSLESPRRCRHLNKRR